MKHNVHLRPFRVPNYVLVDGAPRAKRQDGFVESPKLALHELSEETLIALCDKFKEDVLRKAKEARDETTL